MIHSHGRSLIRAIIWPVRGRLAMIMGMVLGLTSLPALAADREGKFLLIMDPPTRSTSTWAWDMLHSSGRMEAVVNNLQASFTLPHTLVIHFGEDDGPRYLPDHFEIRIPYGFVAEIAATMARQQSKEGGSSVKTDTLDVVEWVLYHELGHAFIDVYDLPVLGKEEDAADALATLLAIRLVENGGRIALTAADLLTRIAADRGHTTQTVFWSEHSLDRQRFFQVICWVYGSDTAVFAPLAASGTISRQRAQRCTDAFALMA
ncbi:MAG: hypothetical protein HQL73_13785, partial [Magnetococcales bacterium]|nr:hypothetical protein [Magnetococcales bacterium]